MRRRAACQRPSVDLMWQKRTRHLPTAKRLPWRVGARAGRCAACAATPEEGARLRRCGITGEIFGIGLAQMWPVYGAVALGGRCARR